MAENLTLEDLQVPGVASRRGGDPFGIIGIIGLGVMGRGITETVASHGIRVIAVERDEKSLAAGLEGLSHQMDIQIRRWGTTKSEKRAILSRTKGTTTLADLEKCSIIIEAVD
ncbi:MAG: 3-hydroxyacyl-CoA dehydrogenase NAD-binding domain-containing protein, partial [Bacteroidota bacterium]